MRYIARMATGFPAQIIIVPCGFTFFPISSTKTVLNSSQGWQKSGFFVINRKNPVFWFKPGFFGFYGFNGFFSVCIFL